MDGPAPDQKPKPDQPSSIPGTWETIQNGTFTMGSPPAEACRDPDETQHPVTLTHDFAIQATEVTQGQFQAVMGYQPSTFAGCGACPVETLSWHEAAAYCNALSQRAGTTPCYVCSGTSAGVTCQETAAHGGQKIYACPGYRLPTEAEWEHAYRAQSTSAYYSGSNDPAKCKQCAQNQKDANADAIGWYCANSGLTTHPVGQKTPNGSKLSDMAGNVFEWCHDWYKLDLGASAVTDPVGANTGLTRVIRGGSAVGYPDVMRAAARDTVQPTTRLGRIGFRCCKSL